MGDPSKSFVLQAILDEMQRLNLFEVVKVSGASLLRGLKEMEVSVCTKARHTNYVSL